MAHNGWALAVCRAIRHSRRVSALRWPWLGRCLLLLSTAVCVFRVFGRASGYFSLKRVLATSSRDGVLGGIQQTIHWLCDWALRLVRG